MKITEKQKNILMVTATAIVTALIISCGIPVALILLLCVGYLVFHFREDIKNTKKEDVKGVCLEAFEEIKSQVNKLNEVVKDKYNKIKNKKD